MLILQILNYIINIKPYVGFNPVHKLPAYEF